MHQESHIHREVQKVLWGSRSGSQVGSMDGEIVDKNPDLNRRAPIRAFQGKPVAPVRVAPFVAKGRPPAVRARTGCEPMTPFPQEASESQPTPSGKAGA